jgi:DNA-binding Xre family transcriptional regulator
MEIGFPMGNFQGTPAVDPRDHAWQDRARHDGLYLDFDVLDHQAAIRAITMRQLAEKAGIPEVTLSRARHGRRIRESTLRKLVDALRRTPVIEGAELLVAPAPTKQVGVGAPAEPARNRNRSSAKKKEVRGGTRKTSR